MKELLLMQLNEWIAKSCKAAIPVLERVHIRSQERAHDMYLMRAARHGDTFAPAFLAIKRIVRSTRNHAASSDLN